MALTRTVRVGAASAVSFGTGPYTPAGQPFTPATGSILVAAVEVGFTSSAGTWDPTIADDNADGGTWTQRASNTTAGGWTSGIRVWTRPVITGASMSVTFDQGSVDVGGGYAVSIIEYSGQDSGTPQFGATAKTAAAVDGADSVTLTATPTVDDEVIGFLGREMNTGTATSTPGSTFTEIQEFTTSAGCGMETEIRTGSTSTTVDWVDLNTAADDLFRVHLACIGITAGAAADMPDVGGSGGGRRFFRPGRGPKPNWVRFWDNAEWGSALDIGASGTDAPAEAATATGTANAATAQIAPTAGVASATGAANAAQSTVKPTAGVATGTGAANAATVQVAPTAGAASGTGTANTASSKVAPNASTASGTGTANNATATTGTIATAGAASGTGTANGATVTIATNAGAASGTGTASSATVKVAPAATAATATGTANSATAKVSPTAAAATGTGTANDATATTGSGTSAPAGTANGTGTANGATVKIAPTAGVASGTGAANNATASTTAGTSAPAGVASAIGAAAAATVKVSPLAGTAAATGTALNASTVPQAVILVDRIDVWQEPSPATYEEPSPILWLEPTKANHEEPEPAGWREPSPAQGVS
jgi:hypothetical protein